MDHLTHELEAYFAGDATDEQVATIEAWINADPINARAFMQQLHFRELVGEHVREQRSDSRAVLAELVLLEAQAEADTVTLVGQVDAPATKVSAHDYAEAGRYLFEHALANKRLLYTAGSAVAAVLLIALSLVFIFSGGPDEPVGDPLADVTLWDTPTPRHLPVVATLTDAVGAQWRSDDKPVPMPMGAQLVAFERYTLTHGFAEITTRRGAKALLQAPATIELTDHDNAIRLHRGKLAGKCETPVSKGFTVHAPGLDVVDIGTEFGVAVDPAGAVHTQVFEGEVELIVQSSSGPAIALKQGEAVRIDRGGSVQTTSAADEGFVKTIPETGDQAAIISRKPMCYWPGRIDQSTGLATDLGWRGANAKAIDMAAQDLHANAKTTHFEFPKTGSGYLETSIDSRQLWDAPFTIEAWCWIEPGQEGAMRIVSNGNRGTGLALGVLGPHETEEEAELQRRKNQPFFTIFGFADFIGETPLPEGQWTHLACTVDWQDRVRLYVDGQETTVRKFISSEIVGGPSLADFKVPAQAYGLKQLAIGRNPIEVEQPEPWVGKLDDLAIYDYVLTPKSVSERNR